MSPLAGHTRTLSALPQRPLGRPRPFEPLRKAARPVHHDSQAASPRAPLPAAAWPRMAGPPRAESPTGAPTRNRSTARPAHLISRHRPSTGVLSVPARPGSVTPASPDGARGELPASTDARVTWTRMRIGQRRVPVGAVTKARRSAIPRVLASIRRPARSGPCAARLRRKDPPAAASAPLAGPAVV